VGVVEGATTLEAAAGGAGGAGGDTADTFSWAPGAAPGAAPGVAPVVGTAAGVVLLAGADDAAATSAGLSFMGCSPPASGLSTSGSVVSGTVSDGAVVVDVVVGGAAVVVDVVVEVVVLLVVVVFKGNLLASWKRNNEFMTHSRRFSCAGFTTSTIHPPSTIC